jgi:hypothetical protein
MNCITQCNPSEKLEKREIRRNKPTAKLNELLIYAITIRLAHSSVSTIHDNADRIKESAKSVCVARLAQSYPNEPYQKTMDVSLLHFYQLEINKYIVQKCMYTVQKCTYTVYTVQAHMSTSGIVIHYGNFVFDLCDVFQERNPGIKRELPVYPKITPL